MMRNMRNSSKRVHPNRASCAFSLTFFAAEFTFPQIFASNCVPNGSLGLHAICLVGRVVATAIGTVSFFLALTHGVMLHKR
jgi:hypothetical protein